MNYTTMQLYNSKERCWRCITNQGYILKPSIIVAWIAYIAIAGWLRCQPLFCIHQKFTRNGQTIVGAVKNSATDKYIENVYIYITSGEEEALSNNKGAFTISTWQDLPVTLVIEHPIYKQKKIRITDASQYQLIKLDPKP